MDHKALKLFISNFVELTENDWKAVEPVIEVLHLKKNGFFIREGKIAKKIAFTNKGYLRVYYNHDGDEITRDISPLYTMITALPSYIKQKPSFEIIQAITDCELLIIKRDHLEFLYDNYPNWQKVGRRIIEEMFVETQNRIYSLITQTAEARYKKMIESFPDIFLHVPLQYIASYLGITSQSLSRLRKTIKF